MEAIANPAALELSKEVVKTVTPSEFVNETLNRKSEVEQLKKFMEWQMEKREKKVVKSAEQKSKEEMLILAIINLFPQEIIEAMRQSAGITETRLAELKEQAQNSNPTSQPKGRKAKTKRT